MTRLDFILTLSRKSTISPHVQRTHISSCLRRTTQLFGYGVSILFTRSSPVCVFLVEKAIHGTY